MPVEPEDAALAAVGPASRGVTVTATDAAPMPTELTARNLIDADTKFVNPVTVTGEDVTGASVHAPEPTRY